MNVEIYYGTNRPMRDISKRALDNLSVSGHPVKMISDNKAFAYECQYQIVIENETTPGFFTEKIVDCFARKIVPIYLGCPNISAFFDADSIIHCASVEEIFEAVDIVTHNKTAINPDAVDRNYELVDYWSNTRIRAKAIIEAFAFSHRIRSGHSCETTTSG